MAYHVQVFNGVLYIQASRMAARRLDHVLDTAVGVARTLATGGPYSAGNVLATSIKRRQGPTPTGTQVTASYGSRLSYAGAVERGAKVHPIFPVGTPHVYRFGSRRRPQLKFFWRKAGEVVYFPHIPGGPSTVGRSHPGQKGKHYLRGSLEAVAARYNMKLIIYPTSV